MCFPIFGGTEWGVQSLGRILFRERVDERWLYGDESWLGDVWGPSILLPKGITHIIRHWMPVGEEEAGKGRGTISMQGTRVGVRKRKKWKCVPTPSPLAGCCIYPSCPHPLNRAFNIYFLYLMFSFRMLFIHESIPPLHLRELNWTQLLPGVVLSRVPSSLSVLEKFLTLTRIYVCLPSSQNNNRHQDHGLSYRKSRGARQQSLDFPKC